MRRWCMITGLSFRPCEWLETRFHALGDNKCIQQPLVGHMGSYGQITSPFTELWVNVTIADVSTKLMHDLLFCEIYMQLPHPLKKNAEKLLLSTFAYHLPDPNNMLYIIHISIFTLMHFTLAETIMFPNLIIMKKKPLPIIFLLYQWLHISFCNMIGISCHRFPSL